MRKHSLRRNESTMYAEMRKTAYAEMRKTAYAEMRKYSLRGNEKAQLTQK